MSEADNPKSGDRVTPRIVVRERDPDYQAALEGALARGDAWLCACGQINGNYNQWCCHCRGQTNRL